MHILCVENLVVLLAVSHKYPEKARFQGQQPAAQIRFFSSKNTVDAKA
jgi:hypothetical protein